MTKSNKKFSRSDITAFLALIMSISALVIGVVEARIMSEQQQIMVDQQKGAVWPYLEVKSSLAVTDSLVFSWTAENKGVGPAIVNGVNLLFKEKTIKTYSELLSLLDGLVGENNYALSKFGVDQESKSVYASGEEKTLLQITFYDPKVYFEKVGFFNLDLKYCSIYGDCWKENGKELSSETKKDDSK